MDALETLPIAVVGGGPVGLAAAAHLQARGLSVKLYESGTSVGASLRDWGHVRVFTPWRGGLVSKPQAFGVMSRCRGVFDARASLRVVLKPP
jgi:2-polyprenyl-6-methoxyphenol hydroxylase-like FAD-dependent oxidoreductase